MKRITTLVTLGGLIAAFLLSFAVEAGATQPFRGTFGFTESFVDNEVCAAAPWGFDVSVMEHEFGFFEIFSDQNGDFSKAIVHNNYDATISANGITIVERDTWTSTYYPDGSRDVGLTVHIQGPHGGIVVRDAGQ